MPLLQHEVGEARSAHALLGISGGDLDFFNRRAPWGFCEDISGEDLDLFPSSSRIIVAGFLSVCVDSEDAEKRSFSKKI